MAELGIKGVRHAFGGVPLLARVDLQIERGERIGLVGRNGAGKSTLLAILSGELRPDGGEVVRRQGLRVASLAQEVPRELEGTVREQLVAALGEPTVAGWETDTRIEQTLSRLSLDPDAPVAALSAGTKRRVLLARALVGEPDLLLLDEPTNHLDIESILGVQELLQKRRGALVFVTHDRMFLRQLATRIVDLDRGILRSYPCDYETYLERNEASLVAEAREHAVFDKKLAEEEAWVRRGIKARRTRNEGRVRALEAMRRDRRARREEVGTVRARVEEADRSGQVVLRTRGLTYSFGDRCVVEGLSTTIMRGDRIGIIGPNGCGKTTLLRLLLGDLAAEPGQVHHGTNLEIATFDQLNEVLDESKTLQQNVCEAGDTVTIGGRSRHIIGYLEDFLFTPEQARGPIRQLSGGERNRLQLARMLARPCNVLVLDEPTNDLDVETLELLEGILIDFSGTLLLVSHDREFLNNVVTSTLVFEGQGSVREYVGGYDDWLRQRTPPESAQQLPRKVKGPRASSNGSRRLTFKERQELESLPGRIEVLESEKSDLVTAMGTPEFYKQDSAEITAGPARLDLIERDLKDAYHRWEELEAIEPDKP